MMRQDLQDLQDYFRWCRLVLIMSILLILSKKKTGDHCWPPVLESDAI
jgi:hypothetical protein